jgi:alkylation response protein AidB-like acyl-CoA dehydrogenase
MAEMSAQIEAARALLHTAVAMADAGRATSVLPLLQAKVVCAEVGVRVTTDLMTMFGGTAFAGRLPFERYLRDARAGLVMGQRSLPRRSARGGIVHSCMAARSVL